MLSDRPFTNRPDSESPARRFQEENGGISFASVVVVLGLTIVISLVGNTGYEVLEKQRTQHAADALAYSQSTILARGMNSLCATQHAMGEMTAIIAVLEALGGPEAGVKDPSKISTSHTRRLKKQISILRKCSESDKLPGTDRLIYPILFKVLDVHEHDFECGAAVLDAQVKILEYIRTCLAVKAAARALQKMRKIPKIGWALYLAGTAMHVAADIELALLTIEMAQLRVYEYFVSVLGKARVKDVLRLGIFGMGNYGKLFTSPIGPMAMEIEALREKICADYNVEAVLSQPIVLPVIKEPLKGTKTSKDLDFGDDDTGGELSDEQKKTREEADKAGGEMSQHKDSKEYLNAKNPVRIDAQKLAVNGAVPEGEYWEINISREPNPETGQIDKYYGGYGKTYPSDTGEPGEKGFPQMDLWGKYGDASGREVVLMEGAMVEEIERQRREVPEIQRQLNEVQSEIQGGLSDLAAEENAGGTGGGDSGDHDTANYLLKFDQAYESKTQWVRATQPYANSMYRTLASCFDDGLMPLINVKQSRLKSRFEYWLKRFVLNESYRFRSGDHRHYKASGGSTGAANGLISPMYSSNPEAAKNPCMYFIRGATQDNKGGNEPWVEGFEDAQKTFSVVAAVQAKSRAAPFSPVFFKRGRSGGDVVFAQAMIYNTAGMNRAKGAANGTDRQPDTSWDTLQWLPNPTTRAPEWSASFPSPKKGNFLKLFTQETPVDDDARIELTWHNKLVPLTSEGLALLSGEGTNPLTEFLDTLNDNPMLNQSRFIREHDTLLSH